MIRGLMIGIFLLGFSAIADDRNSAVEMIVEPRAPLSDRVLFVVDRSGSMHSGHFELALRFVSRTLKAPTDAWRVGFIAFNDQHDRWPGLPTGSGFYPDGTRNKREVPPGWAELPEQALEAMPFAHQWLRDLGANGGTIVMWALRAALSENEENLSIILVSDGDYRRESVVDILGMIEERQAWRESRGLGRAVIHVHSIGPVGLANQAIVGTGPGGLWQEKSHKRICRPGRRRF